MVLKAEERKEISKSNVKISMFRGDKSDTDEVYCSLFATTGAFHAISCRNGMYSVDDIIAL